MVPRQPTIPIVAYAFAYLYLVPVPYTWLHDAHAWLELVGLLIVQPNLLTSPISSMLHESYLLIF
jgi:hypothetical protein